MTTPAKDPQLRVTQACEAGKKFAELFYDKLDKGRTKISGLYMDTAHLVWNGNSVRGREQIVQFYENLPTSDTNLMSIDAQPVLDLPEFSGQETINVVCGGRMKMGTRSKFFTEVFMLTAVDSTWKIVSDSFRDYA